MIKRVTFILLGVFFSICLLPNNASANSGFNPGRIIDDAIFVNKNSMTQSQIQSFLEAKNTNCASGYTCLYEYVENPTTQANNYNGGGSVSGGKSAAQIIYEASQNHSINPQVLLVTLQKETSLITLTQPPISRYDRAMGYGCPDNGPNNSANCNSNYYGFANQMNLAAKQFRRYMDLMNTSGNYYNYERGNGFYIAYSPFSSCGGTAVNIETKATAALYNYTPYQPNSASINSYPGTGDSCSSYGNRNFWFRFNSWFGTPTSDAYSWELIHQTSTGKLYLVSNRTRHHIPNPTVLAAWGLDDESYENVDDQYISSLTAGASLQSVALDANGTRYLMSQGKKFRLKNDGYVLVWGVAGMQHIPAAGLLVETPSGGDAGRFAKTPDGTIYLLNNYEKHLPLNASSFEHWGQSNSNTTEVLASDIAHIANGSSIDAYTTFGGNRRIIDQGVRLVPKTSNEQHGWNSQSYVHAFPFASNILTTRILTSFAKPASQNSLYFVENGNYHKVPNPTMAQIWGLSSSYPSTTISDDLFTDLTNSSSLQPVVKSQNGKLYIMDGKAHEVSSEKTATFVEDLSSAQTYSNESISTLPRGFTVSSSTLAFSGHPHVYSMDSGQLRRIANPTVLDAVGGSRNNKIQRYSSDLLATLSVSSSIEYFVKSGATTYYLENGYRHPISNDFLKTWGATNPSTVSDGFINHFEVKNTGQELGGAISYNGRKYVVNNKVLIDITAEDAAYGATGTLPSISRSYLPSTDVSGFFVQSMTGSKVYALSLGRLYYVGSPQVLSDLGYGVNSGLTKLHPEIISNLLQDTGKQTSRLIKTNTSGIVFASQSDGFTFPNLSTLNEYRGDDDYLVLSASDFSKFRLVKSTTKLISGDNGKVYAVEDAVKRWITNPSLLNTTYRGIPITKLSQQTVDGFVSGPNLN